MTVKLLLASELSRTHSSFARKRYAATHLFYNQFEEGGKYMTIQVLGSGCPTCKKLYELTQKAVEQLGLNEKVEYSTDVSKIIEMGVMSSPVLAVDGKPVLVGFLPDIEKIKKAISSDSFFESKPKKCSCGGKC